MHTDSHTMLSNSPLTNKTIFSSRHTHHHATRISRIKDKRMIYPQSTLSKIVFVTNSEGNGFRRQHFLNNEIPNQIDLQEMINNINKQCYQQWKRNYESQLVHPLTIEQVILKVFGIIGILIMSVFIYLVNTQATTKSIQWLLYAFVILMFLICAVSGIVVPKQRIEVNKDVQMVRTIKKELVRLNYDQLEENTNSARFTWTCHVDCLWVACEFH